MFFQESILWDIKSFSGEAMEALDVSPQMKNTTDIFKNFSAAKIVQLYPSMQPS